MIDQTVDRPSVQYDDDTDEWWIRASALGGCIRSLVASGRGVMPQPPPDWMQEKFDEGHAAEPVLESMAMESLGHRPFGRPRKVRLSFDTTHGGPIIVSGEVDNYSLDEGAVDVGIPDLIHEYKAMGKSYVDSIRKLGGTPTTEQVLEVLPAPYRTQISVYMHGAARRFGKMIPVALVIGEKDEGGVVRSILPIVMIREPPVPLEDIEKRASHIVNMVIADGDGEFPDCDVAQYPCGHFFLHDDEEVPVVGADDRARFRLAVDTIEIAKGMTDAAAQMKKDANAVIRDVMGDNKKVLLPAQPELDAKAGEVTVSWVVRQMKERVQTVKAHTQEFPKITRRDAQKENS
jgi:hypothetical protein